MNSESKTYLLSQQREIFKSNWKSELEFWVFDWDDEECETFVIKLSKCKNYKQVLSIMDVRYNYKGPSEYIYHNVLNQRVVDRREMCDDILNEARLMAKSILERKIQQLEFVCEECPICYETLDSKIVPVCGHPLCMPCSEIVDRCPTCRGPM